MNYTTRALFLRSIRYGERAFILRFYTERQGLKSYVSKGNPPRFGKSKNASFSPLSIHQLEAAPTRKGGLDYLRTAHTELSFLTSHPAKTAIVFFLAELLDQVLREAESNPPLFDYLIDQIRFLKGAEHYANFHLCFVLDLTRYLGFYPDLQGLPTPYFGLQEGTYLPEKPESYFVTGAALDLLQRLSRLRVTEPKETFSRAQRKQLLNTLERYYRLHLAGFKPFQSLSVLGQLFD
ncbi:MAG: DNA repair protein RecO C-terminal domain-containing protein [Flavobacteriales bacterium]